MAKSRLRFKRVQVAEVEGPGEPSLTHPRLNWTQAQVATVQSNIDSDATYRARWETHWSEFRTGSGTKWTANPVIDPYALAYAAHMVYLRTDGDHGINWGESRDQTLTTIREGVASAAFQNALAQQHSPTLVGLAHIYTNLHNDLLDSERNAMVAPMTEYANQGQWKSVKNVWDDQLSTQHIAKALCGMVLDDFEARRVEIYDESVTKWAMSMDWMAYATGIGYEWKDAHACQPGLLNLLLCIRNAYGFTTGETLDTMRTHLRDSWWLLRRFAVPHASIATRDAKNFTDHINQSAPDDYNSIILNVGAHMLWGLAVLPGTVDLSNGLTVSEKAALAADEDAFLGYMQYEWTRLVPGSATRMLRTVIQGNGVQDEGAGNVRGGRSSFFSFPAWLILNAQEPAEVDPTTGEIPKVRRFWPGTLDWTIIRSTLLEGQINVNDTLASYHHRRWSASGYENGTKTNGSWHLHRGGPLFGQRGNASHGPVTRFETSAGTGCKTFEDGEYNSNEWPEMTHVDQQAFDNSGARIVPESRGYRELIEAEPWTDYGQVIRWSADDKSVAIASDLKRNYNCDVVQTGEPTKNQRKLSDLTSEWVCIPRGADGTDRTKIFHLDRITLLDAKFTPVYNVNPMPPQITIDGVEQEFTWPGTSDPALNGAHWDAPNPQNWTATGPNHWKYTGGSYIETHNQTEPQDATPGTGRGRVTCLEPSGANLVIVKRGGTNLTSSSDPSANGQPYYQPTGGWVGIDDRWDDISGVERRAYTGLYTCGFRSVGGGTAHNFLIAAEDLPASEAPNVPTTLTCDAGSKAARLGPSAVLFGTLNATRTSASLTLPSGITLLVITNLVPSTTYTVTPTGVGVLSANRVTAADGRLTLTLDGVAGSIALSQGVASALDLNMGIGAVTHTTARAWVRADGDASIRLKVSPNADLSGATLTDPVAVDSATDFCGQIPITGLSPFTEYYYDIVVDGVDHFGSNFPKFKTFPTPDTDEDFTVAVGSCQRTPTQAQIYASVKNESPLTFLQIGDFHYGDTVDPTLLATAYKNMLVASGDYAGQIVHNVSTGGTVSDHDAGGNNVQGNLPNKANYVTAFDRYRPHYDFAFPGSGVTQFFKMGNVQVALMDCRYNRESSKAQFPETGGANATDVAQSGTTTTKIVSTAHADLLPFNDFYNGWYGRIFVGGVSYYRRVVDTVDLGSHVEFHLNSAVPGLAAGAPYRLRRCSMLDKDNVGITEALIDLMNSTTSKYGLIVFDTPFHPGNTASDSWGGHEADFMEGNYILQHLTKDNVDIVTGDRHEGAIDDGTAGGSGTGRAEMTTSPMNESIFSVLGTWTHGKYANLNYGTIAYTAAHRTLRIKDASGNLATGITALESAA